METLKPPSPLSFEGNVAENWRKWKQRFQFYLEATETDQKAEKLQCALLLHVVGEEGVEVFNTFTFQNSDVDKIVPLLEKYEAHCAPLKNVTYERHKFFTRSQGHAETVDQFVTELKNQAKKCEFAELRDSLIKDRIVGGISSDPVRARLLREPELSLKKAVDICRISESTSAQLKDLNETSHDEHKVHVVKQKKNTHSQGNSRSNYRPNPKKGGHKAVGGTSHKTNKCGQCGSDHPPRQCPAYGKTCYKCGVKNHYKSMCRGTASSGGQAVNHLFIGVVNRRRLNNRDWETTLSVNNHLVDLKLDTGAQANVLPEKTFRQLKGNVKLQKSNAKLSTYSGQNIPVMGKCKLLCKNKNKTANVEFLIVKLNSMPILGQQACEEWNLVKQVKVDTVNSNNQSKLLNKFNDLFSDKLGCLPREHHIEVDSSVIPVVHAPRRLPVALRDRVQDELSRMEDLGVIAKVDEPTEWVSSMVVVEKPNGKLRICLDPKDLNVAIRREHYQLPTSDEVSSMLSGAKYFSKLDASSGFWQVKIDAESSKLTTFNTPYGRYCFQRLPFGIKSAPEVFHKMICNILYGIDGVKSIIDDILIWGSTREEHDRRLEHVLSRLQEVDMSLNKDKCKFGLTEVVYFGHRYTADGVQPDETKVKAIVEMPTPENKKDLQRFLGMINYLAKFVKDLSTIAAPLRNLLKNDVLWFWDVCHEESYNALKALVTNAPVLQFYDVSKPVKLSVDASMYGLGAVLLQEDRPVEYSSKTLNETQKGYAQIEKELLAIVYGCERFHQYVYGRQVLVETDHKPLVTVVKKSIRETTPRLQRLLMRLQRYQLQVIYKPGKEMHVADQLSRAPLKRDNNDDEITEDVEAQIHLLINNLPVTSTKLQEFQRETLKDETLQQLTEMIQFGWPDDKHQVPQSIQPYYNERADLTVSEHIVFKCDRIIVPASMRKEILKVIHEGHFGMTLCKARAREAVYWPGMNSQIEDFVSKCEVCCTYRNANTREPLQPHEIPSGPWEKVGTDLFQIDGHSYLLIVDYHSKFVEMSILSDTCSKTVITHMKSIFARYGIPYEVISDNGPQYSSREFKTFSQDWTFKHTTSSPHYAQSNGMAERSVQTVKNMLKKAVNDGKDPYLALLEFRNTPGDSGSSPAQLLMGRRLRSSLPMSSRLLKPSSCNVSAHQAMKTKQNQQKSYYDCKSKPLKPFKQGDNVKYKNPGMKYWKTATVVEVNDENRSYVIRTPEGTLLRRNRVHLTPSSKIIIDEQMEDDEFVDSRSEPISDNESISSTHSDEETAETTDDTILSEEELEDDNDDEQFEDCDDQEPTYTRAGRRVRVPERFRDYVN